VQQMQQSRICQHDQHLLQDTCSSCEGLHDEGFHQQASDATAAASSGAGSEHLFGGTPAGDFFVLHLLLAGMLKTALTCLHE